MGDLESKIGLKRVAVLDEGSKPQEAVTVQLTAETLAAAISFQTIA